MCAVGHEGRAYKEIVDTGQGRSNDFTEYESLSFFIRDGTDDADPRSEGSFFFRFGPDTTNFYEFST